jgi:hypothetical protein
MNYIYKIWARIIISILFGGLSSELIYQLTTIGAPNGPDFFFMGFSLFCFIILSQIVSIHKRKNKKPFGEKIRNHSLKK